MVAEVPGNWLIMARPSGRTQFHHRLAGRVFARYIKFVGRSAKVVAEPPDALSALAAEHPCIVAVWHGQFMMTAMLHPGGITVKAMVAKHGDAELIGQALSNLNTELIRGAGAGDRKKDRGGAGALRAAVRAVKDGASLVMTADVPPGPARKAGIGIITIARMAGRPIVPVATATSRFKAFRTWSRLTVNYPYSRLAVVKGDPIFVPPDAGEAELEACRVRLENSLNEITRRAYELAGGDVRRIMPPHQLTAADGRPDPGFALSAYRFGSGLLAPATRVLLALRERQGKEDPARRGERLGLSAIERPRGRLVWVHAASVGETNAVAPLIDAMADRLPDLKFLLTTGTVTSASVAARRLSGRAIHQYVPLDIPAYAERFLDHWRPDLAIFTESEIWPNLILETEKRAIPLALVNGRMSPRSLRRWRRNLGLAEPLFSSFDIILAQNDRLARGFSLLGARNVKAVGNLKIDAPPPPVDAAELERLELALSGRPRFVAASTHDGEEAIIGAAHRAIAARVPGLCTILAPRHPGRGPLIAETLAKAGLTVQQRSREAAPRAGTDIYIADTIGELGTFYALAPVAFIGGSLIPHGGQNPIEAVRRGAAVLVGPFSQNFSDEYAALIRKGGALEVRDAEQLASVLTRLISDDAETRSMRERAGAALQSLSGALGRTLDALAPFIPAEPRLERAT